MRHKNGSSGSADKPANPEDIAARRFHATRCKWTTSNRQCLLTGTSSPDVGGGSAQEGATVTSPRSFCAWHRERLDNGRGNGDSAEFAEWLEVHREQFPARHYGQSDYTRFEADTLWQAAIGIDRVPLLDAPARQSGMPASSASRKAAYAKVGALLSGRFA